MANFNDVIKLQAQIKQAEDDCIVACNKYNARRDAWNDCREKLKALYEQQDTLLKQALKDLQGERVEVK